jgi:hypothetical protein
VILALEGGRLSVIRTGRLYNQEYPGTHILEAESIPGTWNCRMPRKQIPSDATGDRSRDIRTSSATPSPLPAITFGPWTLKKVATARIRKFGQTTSADRTLFKTFRRP